MGRRFTGRRLLIVGLAVVAVAVGSVGAAASLAYSPGYVFRVLAWQEADVGDVERFPAREVAAAPRAFSFSPPGDSDAAARLVEDAIAASGPGRSVARDFLESTGTQALLVVRGNELLYEAYLGDFRRDSVGTSFSVAKSYVSALVGIAIGEGSIRSPDDPITRYLPELLDRDERFGAITIRHLLSMTSGLRYEEDGLLDADDSLTYYFDDLRRLALERTEVVRPPGEQWLYNNYNPLLLGLILERATGMSVAEYLESRLWTRIGTEYPASWSLDRDGGFEKMESGINARAIDFAKLGRLYLNGGAWGDRQVVPAQWVEAAFTETPRSPDSASHSIQENVGEISHPMYWWRITRPNGEVAISGLGNLGQIVFAAPAQDVVIVRLGREHGMRSFAWLDLFADIADAVGTTSATANEAEMQGGTP